MKDTVDQSGKRFGVLANGSSPRWDVAVDEALDRDGWWLEIEGPQTYFVFQLRDLEVVRKALRLLEEGLRSGRHTLKADWTEGEGALTLGRFGPASVSLLWDNEDYLRFFIVVGRNARSTIRLSLEKADVKMLVSALKQVVSDIAYGT
jgi:hypothetical protein